MIKVLHIIPTLSSGGAERQLLSLISNTNRKKIRNTVAVFNNEEFFGPHITIAGGEIINLEIYSKHPFFQASREIRRLIQEEKPDVVHSWLYDANVSARLGLLGRNKIPLITSLQSCDYDPSAITAAGWSKSKVTGLKIIDQITAFISKPYFIACSEYVRHSYRRNFKVMVEKSQVIYNAVDFDLLNSDPKIISDLEKEIEIIKDSFILTNVGRLDQAKNQIVILQAVAVLKDRIPNLKFLMVGAGNLEKRLKAQAKELGINDKVYFLGRRDNIGSILEISDIFVFPSLLEGLPVALIEAMSKALPCVSSDIEVCKEVIIDRENGLLVDPYSAEQLADAILELHQNTDLRKRIGQAAYKTVLNKFDAKELAKKWEDLYESIAKR